jgi:hypothetical protein
MKMKKKTKLTKEEKAQKKWAKKEEKLRNRKYYGRPSLSFSGSIAGAGIGGMGHIILTGKGSLLAVELGIIIGLLLSIAAGYWIRNKPERLRMQVQYGVCGLLPGFMIIGNPYLIHYAWGAILGSVLMALLFAFVLAPFLYRLKTKGKYQSFPGEGGLFSVFGLIMSYAGDEIAGLIFDTKLFAIPKQVIDIKARKYTTIMIAKKGLGFTIAKTCIGFIVPFLLVLVTFLWIGYTLAANRRRPVFGATLAIIGGSEVAFIGFKVAPMLFVPGSGLVWVGLIDGLLIIAMSFTAIYYSLLRVPLGVVVIVLSILSYVGAAGGLIFGGLLGIFGGAMITTWQPSQEQDPTQKTNHFTNSQLPSQNMTV